MILSNILAAACRFFEIEDLIAAVCFFEDAIVTESLHHAVQMLIADTHIAGHVRHDIAEMMIVVGGSYMYQFLAFFSGVILAMMIQMNGGLTVQFGVYHASLYIHIVGAIFATVILTAKKRLPRLNRQIPWWMYLSGVIGVFTTVFNNVAFSHISLTSIVALGLFAQLSCSWLIDRFGLFGMQKQDENQLSIPGMLISMVGIIFMLD